MHMARFVDYFNITLMCPEDSETHLFNKRSPCRLLIATMGTQKELSFANCPHLDKGDLYSKKQIESIQQRLNTYSEEKCDDVDIQQHVSLFGPYITRFDQLLNLSTPTTCCYQEIKQEECNMIQYFLMQGLESCVRLENFMAHHFYSGSFVRNTLVCIAVDGNNKVHVSNRDKYWGTMLGWGKGRQPGDAST